MKDDTKYDVFHRTWWRIENGRKVPGAGEKHYLAHGVSWKVAREICQEWNSENDPGELSDKAEFEEE